MSSVYSLGEIAHYRLYFSRKSKSFMVTEPQNIKINVYDDLGSPLTATPEMMVDHVLKSGIELQNAIKSFSYYCVNTVDNKRCEMTRLWLKLMIEQCIFLVQSFNKNASS